MNDSFQRNASTAGRLLTLPAIIEREQLTAGQALVVFNGLKWASKFGLLQDMAWFDLDNVRTAMVLSIIIETARRSR